MLELREALGEGELELARALFREYRGVIDAEICLQGFDDEVRELPGAYARPRGRLILAWLDGRAVGCAALRPVSGSTAELKRLYVRPDARGHAIGEQLLQRILEEARALGYRSLTLDTLPSMKTAQRLYERFGFVDTPGLPGPDHRRFMARSV